MTNYSTNRTSLARSSGRLVLACLVVAAITACGSDRLAPTAPPEDPVDSLPPREPPKPTPNFIELESDSGDYIGKGLKYHYTQATAVISVSAAPGHLSLTVTGDEWWIADMQTPEGEPFQLGTYDNLVRYPFNDAGTGGLDWSGEGRGCNTLTGSFTVDSVTYSGTELTAIDLHFEQHCEGASAALRGTIHWRNDDTTGPAGPVNPIPSDLWTPNAAYLPASGNYVHLESDPGDWIGQGVSHTYTAPDDPIALTASGGKLSVSVAGWGGDFVAMLGTVPLTIGYYGGLQRYPFNNPAKGGLDWSGYGRGCNTLTGWFAVDRILYDGTTVTAFDMRFEQHCEGGAPALRGAIHWSA